MDENEQKQRLSFAYVRAVAAVAGYGCTEIESDDNSIDLLISARGKLLNHSIARSPQLFVQVKSTELIDRTGDQFSYPLKLKNYEELRESSDIQRILIVLLLPSVRTQWLEQTDDQMIVRYCAYYQSLRGAATTSNTSSVTVGMPRANRFTVDALRHMMSQISLRIQL